MSAWKLPSTGSAESAANPKSCWPHREREGTAAPPSELAQALDFLRVCPPKRGSFIRPAAAPPQGGGAGRGCGAGTAFLRLLCPCQHRPSPAALSLLGPPFPGLSVPAGVAFLRPPCPRRPRLSRGGDCAVPSVAAPRVRGSRAHRAEGPVWSRRRGALCGLGS